MRGASTIRRAAGSAVVAATLVAAGAGSASAAIGPACTARLAEAASAPSCSFDTPRDWATITVAPSGPATVTIRCTFYGYTITHEQTVPGATAWAEWTPGTCTLTLTANPGIAAVASATPTTGPIFEPYHPVP